MLPANAITPGNCYIWASIHDSSSQHH